MKPKDILIESFIYQQRIFIILNHFCHLNLGTESTETASQGDDIS
jgi:hypothetical protein